jgi:mRNA interferase MazF
LKKGEIWLVDLDPTRGAEMKKTRPCIILNNDKIGRLPLKIVAPITDMKEHYRMVPWMVGLEPDMDNGLEKPSAIDLFQVRSISEKRLVKKIGHVDDKVIASCKEALEVVFG